MFRKCADMILGELREALSAVDERSVEALCRMITAADRVFFMGTGRVMMALQCFCKRLNHLGISAYCVGDVGEPAATADSLLIVGSGSGETVGPVAIVKRAAELKMKIAHIGSNPNSSIRPYADLFVRIPVRTKLNLPDEIVSGQIMSSLFEQSLLLLGDAVCLMLADEKKVSDLGSLWQFHANLE